MCERDEAVTRWDQGTADTLCSNIRPAQLSVLCVKDEIYIRSREDVTEIPWVPHWTLGHKLRPGLGITMIWVSFYSVHMWEGESGSTKFKQLVWARERAARGANILQFFWKYFTKIFVKLGRRRRLEKWNLRLRLLFTKPRRWKRFYWAGLKCEMVCEALTDDILSVFAAAGESDTCSLNTGLEEMDFHCILTIHKHLVLIIISPRLLNCPGQFSLV